MSEDKVGNAEVAPEEFFDLDDLLDSEKIAVNKVLTLLQARIGQSMEGSAMQREVRERFAEIGFVARCDLYKDANDPRAWEDKPWVPSISIVGRTEDPGEFDHERMGHEVRSNILGEKGRDNVQKAQVATGFQSTPSGLIIPGGGPGIPE